MQTALKIEDNVFRPPPDVGDRLPGNGLNEFFCGWQGNGLFPENFGAGDRLSNQSGIDQIIDNNLNFR